MSLRDEQKEAMAQVTEQRKLHVSAGIIREENWGRTFQGYTLLLDVAQAVLSVCDEYEEVEVQAAVSRRALRLPDNPYWDHDKPSFTVYRKKQKSEPTLEELVRRAVKAWEKDDTAHRFHVAMSALAKVAEK